MITIIIPVYNVIDYLDDCIRSVIDQTYKDFECILIDDGSSDGSSDKCDWWASKDIRIRVFHQHNQGVSSARNKGLSFAEGDYITFIDSDDYVDPHYLEVMAAEMLTYNPDLVVSGLIETYPSEQSIRQVPESSTYFRLDTQHLDVFISLNEKFLLFSPCVKLYKKDIIIGNELLFDTTYAYGEDLLFNYAYLKHVRKIACISEAFYYYRRFDHESLSHKKRKDQFFIDYKQWKVLYLFYEQKELLNQQSEIYLYRRLWGIVYDGIFNLEDKNLIEYFQYLRRVLAIPEISQLKEHETMFTCSSWIKKCVLGRHFLILFLILKLK